MHLPPPIFYYLLLHWKLLGELLHSLPPIHRDVTAHPPPLLTRIRADSQHEVVTLAPHR